MKGYKKLIGKGNYGGRFYKVNVKVKDDKTKVTSIRKISENSFKHLETTYLGGQDILHNYMTKQAEAMEATKKKVIEKKYKKIADDEAKAKEPKPTVKLTWWQKVKAFFANLFGKKI